MNFQSETPSGCLQCGRWPHWSTVKNVDLQFGDISPMFLCVSGMSPTTVGECEQADTGSVKLWWKSNYSMIPLYHMRAHTHKSKLKLCVLSPPRNRHHWLHLGMYHPYNLNALGLMAYAYTEALEPVIKVVLWSRGLTCRSQVGENPIPIPTTLIWRYLGIK